MVAGMEHIVEGSCSGYFFPAGGSLRCGGRRWV